MQLETQVKVVLALFGATLTGCASFASVQPGAARDARGEVRIGVEAGELELELEVAGLRPGVHDVWAVAVPGLDAVPVRLGSIGASGSLKVREATLAPLTRPQTTIRDFQLRIVPVGAAAVGTAEATADVTYDVSTLDGTTDPGFILLVL